MNVLIVDDNVSAAELMVDVLSAKGFEATALNDSRKAIALIRELQPDIIVLDIMMPWIDGITLCQSIKSDEELKKIKVVMFTCKDFIEDREKAASAGVDGFINKNTDPDEVASIIKGIVSVNGYVKFWGTRGSLPTPDPDMMEYGGDTSCVEVRLGDNTLILDAGTGIRKLGNAIVKEKSDNDTINLFLSHFHWDHTQGFPFFIPVYNDKMKINIHGCKEGDMNIYEVLKKQMGFPYFPVPFKNIAAKLTFYPMAEGEYNVKDINVKTVFLNHPGSALGFRLQWNGKVIVYIPDNELNLEESSTNMEFEAKTIAFCSKADILIHDAQYTPEEYKTKKSWGHSTYTNAVNLAMRAEVRRLYLFHHDPTHTDEDIANIVTSCREMAAGRSNVMIEAAKQGTRFDI